MFAKATRLKLRFASDRGLLSVEDLWDLSLESLNTLAKGLKTALKAVDEEDFLAEKTTADEELQLKFDIVLNVLTTKKNERAEREQEAERKMKRQRIMGLIAEKQDSQLREKSIEELTAELEALS